MNNILKQRTGYKHTPLGWVPDEWEVKEISDIAILSSGTTPSRQSHDKFFHGGHIPWVKTTDLNNSDIVRTEELITEVALRETNLKLLPEGTILVAMYGGFNQIGRTGLLKVSATINQALTAIQLTNADDPKYILEWLNYRVRYWKNFAGSSRKDPNITRKDICDFPVIVPTESEQKRIAAILMTWDQAISKTQQIIDKLLKRNKVLAHQLLTASTRLAEFSDEWNEISLCDAFDERNETGYVNLNLLSVGSIGIYPQTLSEKRDVSNNDKSKYKRICAGDIGYNTMRMWQGRSALSKFEGIVSPAYTIVKPKEGHYSPYYSYLFKLPTIVHKFFRNSQGLVEDTLNCKFKDFSKIKVYVPKYKEQVAISNVLIAAESELEIYKKKLFELQRQKKGLMQKLLTGQVRVNTTKLYG